jgi:hypothetical protein
MKKESEVGGTGEADPAEGHFQNGPGGHYWATGDDQTGFFGTGTTLA